MRFPEYNPPNLPQKENLRFIPTEDDIASAKQGLEEARRKYEQSGNVVDKINLVEAETRLDLLEKDANLDFTKKEAIPGLEVKEDTSDPETKLAQAKRGVDIATRGLEFASKLGDQDMVDLMKRKLEEYQGTIAMLEPIEKPAQASNDSDFDHDFDKSLYAFGDGQLADRLAKRKTA